MAAIYSFALWVWLSCSGVAQPLCIGSKNGLDAKSGGIICSMEPTIYGQSEFGRMGGGRRYVFFVCFFVAFPSRRHIDVTQSSAIEEPRV